MLAFQGQELLAEFWRPHGKCKNRGGFHLSPRHWPPGSQKPRVLGTWGFKESRSVLSPDPEGPESLESFRCHLQASVPTPRVPQDPPCCLPFRNPSKTPSWEGPPRRSFLPAQGRPPAAGTAPGAAHRHPPGAAGWTSASCRASSGGPGPLPVGGHKVRAEARGGLPRPLSDHCAVLVGGRVAGGKEGGYSSDRCRQASSQRRGEEEEEQRRASFCPKPAL